MTKEEKQLLLKDLCARLPYHLGIRIYNDSWEGCRRGEFDNVMRFHHVEAFLCDRIEILPYLRPMSDMTEEEKEWYHLYGTDCTTCTASCAELVIDWLNAHHFDFRDLIGKGLALEAPKDMYPIH